MSAINLFYPVTDTETSQQEYFLVNCLFGTTANEFVMSNDFWFCSV